MFRFLLFIFFVSSTLLFARENPFFPVSGEEDFPLTSNKIEKLPPLKDVSITLPSSARIIKKVTVEFENMDASIQTKSINLNNTVDWHLPLKISQEYKKDKTVSKKSRFKKVGSVRYASFYVKNKTLKIATKDKIIRNFIIANPQRIVVDFKRDSYIKTYIKSTNTSFKKIRVGTHKGYYRVVIELDGLYRYLTKKVSGGYEFSLY